MTQGHFVPPDVAATPTEQLDAETAFFDLVAACGPSEKATVELGRYTSGDVVYLRKYQAAAFTKDLVAQEHGGGHYRGQLKRNGQFVKSCSFHVAGPPAAVAGQPAATPVASPTPAGGNDLVVAILREELAGMRSTLNTLLASQAAAKPEGGGFERELLMSLMADRSGAKELLHAMTMLERIKGDKPAGGDETEARVWTMLDKLADKVLSGRPARKPVDNQAAVAGKPPPGPPATPVAAAEASDEPEWLREIAARYNLPLGAMVKDLVNAVATEMDVETAGIVLYRRVIRATPAARFTDDQVGMLESLDEKVAAGQLCKSVVALEGKDGYVADVLAGCISLVLGDVDDAKKGAAA